MNIEMIIEHIAMYVNDLEAVKKWMNLPNSLELMEMKWLAVPVLQGMDIMNPAL